MAKKPDNAKRPIVIRREDVVEGGHHGGAWKVAYADFVTAMMAFFLLMWLLNATTEAQRRGLADYFTPNNEISRSNSGNGAPFGGRTPFDAGSLVSDRGAMTIIRGKATATVAPDDAEDPNSSEAVQPRMRDETEGDPASAQTALHPANRADGAGGAGRIAGTGVADGARPAAPRDTGAEARTGTAQAAPVPPPVQGPPAAHDRAARGEAEKAGFERAAQQIRDAVRSDPMLASIANQIAIDQTPEGLRVQLMDEDHLPMFATGSAVLTERARLMLQKIAPVLAKLPEGISVTGHTDAAPYRGGDKTNWELSSERANATRRLLTEAGLAEARFRSVSGDADRDPLLPADPLAAANRRMAIMVLRDVRPVRR